MIYLLPLTDASPIPEKTTKGSLVDTSPISAFEFPWLPNVAKNRSPITSSDKNPQFDENVLELVMRWLPFQEAYNLVSRSNLFGQKLNPLSWSKANPLKYHDAHSDDQSAIKKVSSMEVNHKLKYLHFLLQNPTVDFSKLDDSILNQAISIGDLDLIRTFVSKGIFSEKKVLDAALNDNAALELGIKNYKIVKYLIQNYNIIPNYVELDWMIEFGDFKVIKDLIEKNHLHVGFGSLYAACRSGNLDLVKYFLENHSQNFDRWDRFSPWAVKAAAGKGHLEIVKYLIEVQKVPIDDNMLQVALLHRRDHVAEYFRNLHSESIRF